MTINQLLFNHQFAKINAVNANSTGDQDTYFHLVCYYARRIAQWHRSQSLSITGWPIDERQ